MLKDKKLEEAIDYVCSACPYIAEPEGGIGPDSPFANGLDENGTYDPGVKYCNRCMVSVMHDYYEALDSGREPSDAMPEYRAIRDY